MQGSLTERFRLWLRDWLFPEYKQDARERMEMIIATLGKQEHTQPETVAPKKEVVHKPFRVNRVPGRKLRAELEWQNSPEFKKRQAQIRENAARQPQGEAHGR